VAHIFYGVSPAVIALIVHSCYRLAKLGGEDWLQWVIAAACFVVTVPVQRKCAAVICGGHRRDCLLRHLFRGRQAPVLPLLRSCR